MNIEISERLADELRQWVQDERDHWPKDTAYQTDLAHLAAQLDAGLPSAADVRGIMAQSEEGKT